MGNKQDAPPNVVYALKIHIPHGRELLFIPCTGSLEPQIEYSAVSRLYTFMRNMKNNALLVYLKELLSSLEEWCGDLKLIVLWVVLGFLLGVFVDSCFVYVEHDRLMEENACLRGIVYRVFSPATRMQGERAVAPTCNFKVVFDSVSGMHGVWMREGEFWEDFR